MLQCALIEKYDEITKILHFVISIKQGNFALMFVIRENYRDWRGKKSFFETKAK